MNKLQYIKLLELRGITELTHPTIGQTLEANGGDPTVEEMAQVNEMVMNHYLIETEKHKAIVKEKEEEIKALKKKIEKLNKRDGGSMKEDLVTIPTALLAKNKGFDWECRHAVPEGKEEPIELPYYDGDGSGMITNKILNSATSGKIYKVAIPTQSLLQKWLRRELNTHIWVESRHLNFDKSNKAIFLYRRLEKDENTLTSMILTSAKHWYTYEEAFEEGLKTALKLIKT